MVNHLCLERDFFFIIDVLDVERHKNVVWFDRVPLHVIRLLEGLGYLTGQLRLGLSDK
jgi:hypothetical protein